MVAVAAAGGPGPGWQVARWQRGGSVVAVASLPRLCQKSGVRSPALSHWQNTSGTELSH